jgi:hypothetical protein
MEPRLQPRLGLGARAWDEFGLDALFTQLLRVVAVDVWLVGEGGGGPAAWAPGACGDLVWQCAAQVLWPNESNIQRASRGGVGDDVGCATT